MSREISHTWNSRWSSGETLCDYFDRIRLYRGGWYRRKSFSKIGRVPLRWERGRDVICRTFGRLIVRRLVGKSLSWRRQPLKGWSVLSKKHHPLIRARGDKLQDSTLFDEGTRDGPSSFFYRRRTTPAEIERFPGLLSFRGGAENISPLPQKLLKRRARHKIAQ